MCFVKETNLFKSFALHLFNCCLNDMFLKLHSDDSKAIYFDKCYENCMG